jgi:hypothetical protein
VASLTPALRELLGDLTDSDPCELDHHGYCQAHGWPRTEPRCPHARAKELLAEPPAAPVSESVRVVVVVNWRRQRVHGLTSSDTEAQRWTRDIVAKHNGDPLAATMTVGLVAPPVKA